MIRNYFWVILITIKKIIIANTQLVQDDPGTSLEGPLNVLRKTYKLTYKEPLRDSQGTNTKTDDFMKNLFFRSNSRCITYLFLFFFSGRANIQKF